MSSWNSTLAQTLPKIGMSDDVITYTLRIVRSVDSLPIKEEATRPEFLALPLTERVHELFQLCTALDLEEHLVVPVCHFDIQVFAWRRWSIIRLLARGRRRRVIVRHRKDRRVQSPGKGEKW